MGIVVEFLFVLVFGCLFLAYLLFKERRKAEELNKVISSLKSNLYDEEKKSSLLNDSFSEEKVKNALLAGRVVNLSNELVRLEKYSKVADADDEAKRIIAAAREKEAKAGSVFEQSIRDAQKLIDEARGKAEKIGGDAYRALQQQEQIAAAARAMQNVIDGYGDKYLKPSHSVLDDLALTYSHAEAGQDLKRAREKVVWMVENGKAASCDYAESARKQTAIKFVLDAFNGKVDSVLSRVKSTNYGTLEQEIKDAAAMVNRHGSAFRNACILPEYLDARLHELICAVRVRELLERDREEQRAAREQLREEERARKEYERALKETEKEEEMTRKALEKARAMLAKATDEQRQRYEDQIAQLGEKLAAAEEKNKRALSMAQQTRAGHVYVISNLGSFGDGVYKIGMTRRLEPLDRVRELGDASVPFSFDVHAMIWSEDAPALEKTLHREFLAGQVNKVNPRKEFFRVGLAQVRAAVEKMGLSAAWTMAAEAAEYRETQALEAQLRDDPAARAEWERAQVLAESRLLDDEDAAPVASSHQPSQVGAGLFAMAGR